MSAATGSPGNSISIRPASCSSTRPGLGRTWRANADAVGAAEDCAPPFRTAITRRLGSSPACAFAASWRKRPSTGRSMRPRSRNGWKNVSSLPFRKATSSSWTICRATREPRVEQLIKAAGAELRYLPPYSPDMNPIEKAYSKLKAFLRKIAERTVAGLLIALDACADIFKPAECANYFRACGYDTG